MTMARIRLSLALLFLLSALPAAALDPPALLPPEEAAALLAAERDEALTGGADRLVLFDREVVIVEDSGLSHRHRHRFVKVLEPGGALALRALRFDYDPASNTLELRGIRVHRADGGVEQVDAEGARDVAQPTGTINWGARMRVLGLPPLAPGDGVETLTYSKGFLIASLLQDEEPAVTAPLPGLIDSTIQDLVDPEDERYVPPMRGHFYDKIRFAERRPLVEKRYAVSLPGVAGAVIGVHTKKQLREVAALARAFVPFDAAGLDQVVEAGQRLAPGWNARFGPPT